MEGKIIIISILCLVVATIIYIIVTKTIEYWNKKAKEEENKFTASLDTISIRPKDFIGIGERAIRISDIICVTLYDEQKEIAINLRGADEIIIVKEENDNIRGFLFRKIISCLNCTEDLTVYSRECPQFGRFYSNF